jgi:hypothetical protein
VTSCAQLVYQERKGHRGAASHLVMCVSVCAGWRARRRRCCIRCTSLPASTSDKEAPSASVSHTRERHEREEREKRGLCSSPPTRPHLVFSFSSLSSPRRDRTSSLSCLFLVSLRAEAERLDSRYSRGKTWHGCRRRRVSLHPRAYTLVPELRRSCPHAASPRLLSLTDSR